MRATLQWLALPLLSGLLLGTLYLLWQKPPSPEPKPERGYAEAVRRAAPAVANIYTSKLVQARPRHPFLRDPLFRRFLERSGGAQLSRVERSLGSAVVVSEDGYLLTNYHVINEADEILVQLHDGRQALAEVIGSDVDTDLAVLKVDLDMLSPIDTGKIHEAEVGDIVLAIGNPYGFGQTVTQGIVSATGRYGLGINQYENYIQTDADINPGSSGGALVDAEGNLLGINTAVYSNAGANTGIGFAVPAQLALKTMRDLIAFGRPQRGWIGVSVYPVAPSEGRGVVITGMDPRGPAAASGLRAGDILTRIDDLMIGDGHEVLKRIANTPSGTEIMLYGRRGERQFSVGVTVKTRP